MWPDMADPDVLERRTDKMRGLTLGLAVGDAIGNQSPPNGVLQSGVATQLACFTIEGLIRASMRMSHKGICHTPSVIWHAYCRWATVQQITPRPFEQWTSGAAKWPDGWLSQVPALSQRRGNTPATVHAIRGARQGSPDHPATNSPGCQGLIRTLPLGVVADDGKQQWAAELARDTAALTHGHPSALAAAAAGAVIIGHCLSGDDTRRSLESGMAEAKAYLAASPEAMSLPKAMNAGFQTPRQLERLRQLAPASTATAAMRGGLYVAASFPEPEDVGAALAFAALAPHGKSVAAVAGALLGAVHGVSALPVDLVSRLELAWVVDTLARDVVIELTDSPGGSEYTPPRDPTWWDRYPGW
jgi:ADP-ribosylglycohydrolase